MRNTPDNGYWANPNDIVIPTVGQLPFGWDQVIKAADLVDFDPDSGDILRQQYWVQFVDNTNNITRRLLLTPFLMPSGASDITLGTFSAITDGERTFTPTKEGNLISETGALVPSGSGPLEADDVAGMLLTDYYRGAPSSSGFNSLDLTREVTLEEGDLFWIIREGSVQFATDQTVADGDMLMTSNATSGTVEPSGAVGTASVAAHESSLNQNTAGQFNRKSVGRARAARTGAGLVEGDLMLPPRYRTR